MALFEDSKKDGLKLLPLIALSLIIGMYLGNRFPDIDQRTDLVTHRSILTHGFIIPLVLYLIVSRIENPITRFWGIGFNLTVSIHLCFDLFPKGWYMHALIHIPGIGWTWAFISQYGDLYIYGVQVNKEFQSGDAVYVEYPAIFYLRTSV